MRASFNFTFSAAAERVERILKTVFELLFKTNPYETILFLKVSILSEFLIFQPNLFRSIIVDGKKMLIILVLIRSKKKKK